MADLNKELREKIVEIVEKAMGDEYKEVFEAQRKDGSWIGFSERTSKLARKRSNQILALLPDIAKQERERIIKWGDEICPDHWARRPDGTKKSRTPVRKLCKRCWQALKVSKL